MSKLFPTGAPVTETQKRFYASSGRRRLGVLVILAGLATIALAFYATWQITRSFSQEYSDIERHFRHGSIGSEQSSGLPVKLLNTLPVVFPEHFGGNKDYSGFGFLYASGDDNLDLPIGFATGMRNGVDVAWLNCAVCHTGQVKHNGQILTISGMPANQLKLRELFLALFDMAIDHRFNPDVLLPRIEEVNGGLGFFEKLSYRYIVLPQVQQELIERRSKLGAVFAAQPDWGPGRVDTFTAYKLLHLNWPRSSLTPQELVGAADFPSIFLQGPREKGNYELHWDGNNRSLQERNLSAALGAGVDEETVLHHSIERIANWLKGLQPPASLYSPDEALVQQGREIYRQNCQKCHGYAAADGYRFEGDEIGKVVPVAEIGTDRARLDSYTAKLAEAQKAYFFAGDPKYAFRHFRKTDGYANHPLDGLWLRAPYLHNGSVPTLYHLLLPPDQRPRSFIRGLIELDAEKGGFVAPLDCLPGGKLENGFCFSTHDAKGKPIAGNGSAGHEYGTSLPMDQRKALLEYLKTF